ncbi:transcription termination/antitermination NusG family protein [Congregibacter variabilis]|uniref:Transcription termination/antitermination NusG family protein n=1 Tax=Congregibacter variabilis TaxID=3081200 RepID=A0ABZ0I457_9GAMM|nr:transcription termination/antitermination NusG family protein [Congregibacter sp. IMCC43200]
MTWLVVHTKSRGEEQAADQLVVQGYEVFLPRIRERKRRQNRWQWVTAPLFSRYLFVNVPLGEQSVAPIRSTVGVSTLIRFGQSLASMPDAVIEYLRSQQSPELEAREVEDWPHKPGDQVEILAGPFEGLKGIYQLPRGEDRALLMVELLGRQNSIVVHTESLGQVV